MLHGRGGVLHFDDESLHVSLPEAAEADEKAAWGRLAHASWSMDEDDLLSSVLTLVAVHSSLEVDDEAIGMPGLCESNGARSVQFSVPFSCALFDHHPHSCRRKRQKYTFPVHSKALPREGVSGFRLTAPKATPLPPFPPLLPPPDLAWHWLFRTHDRAVRMASKRGGDGGVVVYRNGALDEVDLLPQHPTSLFFEVLVRPHDKDGFPYVPYSAPPEKDALAFLAREVFASSTVRRAASSKAMAAFLASLVPWKRHVLPLWSPRMAEEDVRHLLDAAGKGYVSLVDPKIVFDRVAHVEDANVLGLTMLRRIRTHGDPRGASVALSAVREHSIARVSVLPLTSARLLFFLQAGVLHADLPGVYACSPHGVLLEHEDEPRTLALPLDFSPSIAGMAISSLLPLPASVTTTLSDADEGTIRFAFGSLYGEACCGARPVCDEEMREYVPKLDLSAKEVVLVPLESTLRVSSSLALHDVDGAPPPPSSSAQSRRREELEVLFPKLVSRLRLGDDAFAACLREAQCRRASVEWTMDGWEEGSNLSGLGMSSLLAVCIGAWVGVQVRVLVGTSTRSALVSYGNVLLDPLWVTRNAFDMARFLVHVPEAGFKAKVERGMVLEVLKRSVWRSAIVQRVHPFYNTADVTYLGSKEEGVVALGGECWRIVSTNDRSDLNQCVRLLLQHQNAKRGAAGGEDA